MQEANFGRALLAQLDGRNDSGDVTGQQRSRPTIQCASCHALIVELSRHKSGVHIVQPQLKRWLGLSDFVTLRGHMADVR